jgi:hypothetical protein
VTSNTHCGVEHENHLFAERKCSYGLFE